jgi:hypothetical protein
MGRHQAGGQLPEATPPLKKEDTMKDRISLIIMGIMVLFSIAISIGVFVGGCYIVKWIFF